MKKIYLLTLCSVFFLSLKAQVIIQDSLALVALYNATDGPNWTNNTNWLEHGQNVGDWFGITVENNRVVEVDMLNEPGCCTGDGNNLNGNIPPEMGQLTQLRTLNLASNTLIGGAIPSEIVNLQNLNELILTDTSIDPNLPAELWSLAILERLILQGLDIPQSSIVGIGNLTNLETLWLDGNKLSNIPSELFNLSQLKSLSIANNELTEIPPEISNLGLLEILNLNGNNISSLSAEIFNLSELRQLYLGSNLINGDIFPLFTSYNKLEALSISFNQFSGSIPNEIGNLINLRILNLSGNQISGLLPSEFGDLTNLVDLEIQNNPLLIGTIPTGLSNLENLAIGQSWQNLNFSNTNLCEPTDQAWLDWKQGRNIVSSGITCSPVDLYTFTINGFDRKPIIDNVNQTISLNLPDEDLTSLVASFEVADGATVSIAGTPQVSGTTANDFTNPLTYTITSQDVQESTTWEVTITNQPIIQGVIESDYNGLVDFFNATGGPNWTNKINWLSEEPVEDWFGIEVENERVISIILENDGSGNCCNGNNLTGTIPMSLSELTALEKLNISYNAISGSIPDFFNNLSQLREITFWSNELTGSLPVSIGDLSNLTGLSIGYNQMEGPIPSSYYSLARLQTLNLSYNGHEGTLSPQIGQLESLVNLNLRGNSFEGNIPTELGTLPNLTTLWLLRNDLTGNIPEELASAPKIGFIGLSENNLTGGLPEAFGNAEQLQELDVSDNPLYGPIPSNLINLELLGGNQFHEFNFSNTNLCEPTDQAWLDWKQGRNIVSSGITCSPIDLYSFTIDGFDQQPIFDNANHTISLNLPDEDLTGLVAIFEVVDGATVTIAGTPQVSGTTANDFTNPVTYTITSQDEQESTTWEVAITNQSIIQGVIESDYNALVALYNATDGPNWTNNTNWLSEEPVEDWFGVTVTDERVISIILGNDGSGQCCNGNNLTGSIPNQIGHLTGLKLLDLSYNQLNGELPVEISQLSQLEVLNVWSNDLSGSPITGLQNLTSLESLLLGYNNFSGSLDFLTGLQNLYDIQMPANNFTGEIPTGIGTLVNLLSLDLFNNNLSGEIPSSLGGLSKLSSIDISNNNYSGPLPLALAQITNLRNVNLSNNGWEGEIPAEYSSLTNLYQLNLSNTNLFGPIPAYFTNKSGLGLQDNAGFLRFSNTNICEPTDQAWIDWKQGRNIVSSGITCSPVDLYTFTINGFDQQPTIDNTNQTISLNLPDEDLTSLVASFEVADGATVSITGIPQVSGTTANDFTNPLTYTITSQDEQETSEWTVTITNQSIIQGVIESDYNALVDFYNSTGGPNWTNKTNWLSGEPVGDWFGIEVENERVISIILENDGSGNCCNGNNLTGNIPNGIGELSALTVLTLSFNSLTGIIPTGINNLVNLEQLNLGFNQISGELPDGIENLQNLELLFLENNSLIGQIPSELGLLSKLRSLSIYNNGFSGNIPSQLGDLADLQLLILFNNQLTGSIPLELGNLNNLLSLSLGDNQLSGKIPFELSLLTNLEQLYLNNNLFVGNLPSELGNLTGLNTLDLGNNPSLTGSLPVELTNISDLAINQSWHEFNFSNTNLCEPTDQAWLDWKQGRNIISSGITCGPVDLYSFTIDGFDQQPTIDNANQTISLNLPDEDLTSLVASFEVADGATVTIEGIPQISGTTANDFTNPLTYTITSQDQQEISEWIVTITNESIINGVVESDYNALVAFYNATGGDNWTNNTNWLSEEPAEDWFGIEVANNRVTEIFMRDETEGGCCSGNNLAGMIPSEIGNLVGLEELILSRNELTGLIPMEMGNLVSLRVLDLARNQLNGSIPSDLGGLTNLNLLFLYGNQLTGLIPMELGSLVNLNTLDLSSNQISGSIPVELGGLSNLSYLYLFGNQLTGTIPLEMGSLTSLQVLNLSENSLIGTIPTELGSLMNLRTLYLFNNQLSGSIPTELGSLISLRNLNLSNNDLTGPIPIEFGGLIALERIGIENNPLSGALPIDLINLQNLAINQSWHEFNFSNTNLCEPTDQVWMDWKQGRNIKTSGIICGGANLFEFSLQGFDASPIINQFNKTIDLNLPNADLTTLVADYELSPGATITIDGVPQTNGQTAADFTNPVSLVITSGDGQESNTWTVSITNEALIGGVLESQYNALVSFYNATGGDNWTNNTNWLSEEPVSSWFGVEIENDRVISLGLGGNNLTGQIPAEIGQLVDLRNLGLWTNNLTGNIPDEIGLLVNLENFTLDVNQIDGTIPESIGSLIKLEFLSLNDNLLSGIIPESIANLVNLNFLVLSNNSGLCEPESQTYQEWVAGLDFIDNSNTCQIKADFLSFEVSGQSGETVIDDLNKTVTVTLDCPEEQFLRPFFTLSDGAIAFIDGEEQLSGSSLVDITNPVQYQVVPGFGESVTWSLTIFNSGGSQGPEIILDLLNDPTCSMEPDGSATVNVNSEGSFTYSFYALGEGNSTTLLNCETVEVIENPEPGDYTFEFQDSYGDGWNGAAIAVNIDGVVTSKTLNAGSSGNDFINVPDNTQSLSFAFTSGDWDSEISFQIYAPSGYEMVSVTPIPTVGLIPVYYCRNENTVNGLSAGLYLAEVTDDISGCTFYEFFEILDYTPEYVVNTQIGDQISCDEPIGSILIETIEIDNETLTLQDARFDLTWTDLDGGHELTGLGAGLYEVTILDTEIGCSFTEQFEIIEDIPTLSLESTIISTTNCISANGEISLENVNVGEEVFSLANERFEIVWSDTEAGTERTGLDAGNYEVTITDNQTGCSLTENFEVIEDIQPLIVTSDITNNTICNGGNGTIAIAEITIGETSITLPDQRFEFTWADDEGSNDRTALAAGAYEVTITDTQSGCEVIESFIIEDNIPLVTVDATITAQTNCETPNGEVILNSVTIEGNTIILPDQRFDLVWTDMGSGSERTGLEAGTYDLSIEDTQTGCIYNESYFVEEQTLSGTIQIASNSNVTSCNNNDGTASATVDGETAGYEFSWFTGGSIDGTAFSTSSSISGLGVGSYTVKVSEQGSDCFSTRIINIGDERPSLSVNLEATDNINCETPNGTVSITSIERNGIEITSFGAYDIVWSTSAALTDEVSNDAEETGLAPDRYYVQITDRASGCTSNTASITVGENLTQPEFTISTTNNTLCGASGDGTSTITGVEEGQTIAWFVGESETAIEGETNAMINNLSSGTYRAEVTTTATGCSTVQSFTITDAPATISLIASATNNTSCIAANGSISVESIKVDGEPVDIAGYMIEWSDKEDFSTALESTENLAAGTYYVKATSNTTACVSQAASVEVEDQLPSISINLEGSILDRPGPDATGSISVAISGTNAYTLAWYAGADATGNAIGTAETLADQQAGLYTVQVTDSETGCTKAESFTIGEDDKLLQEISFTLPEMLFQDELPLTLTATSDQGLQITYEIVEGDGTINGDALTTATPGIVTIKASNVGNETYLSAEAEATIEIKGNYDLSGTVAPLSNGSNVNGRVILLQQLGNTLTTVAEVLLSGDNSFLFNDLRAGIYFVRVDVEGADQQAFDTYFNQSTFKEDATGIDLQSDFSIEINMVEVPDETPQGTGRIIGTVVESTSGNRIVTGRMLNGEPLANVNVFLLDVNTQATVAQATTNENGEFEMTGIPSGEYTFRIDAVNAEIINLSTNITFDEEAGDLIISAAISEDGLSIETEISEVTNVEEISSTIKLYPNPAQTYITIESPIHDLKQIRLINLSGQLLQTFTPNFSGQYKLENMKPGLYLLQLETEAKDIVNFKIRIE